MYSMKVPPEYRCPISHEIMKEPTMNETGNSYERKSIEDWYKRNRTDPLTSKPVDPQRLVLNRALKSRIEGFLEESVKKEAVYVIIGKSGSGKSTLINEIACVLGNNEEDVAKTSPNLEEGCTKEVTTYELEICPDKKSSSSKSHVTLIDTMGFPDPHPKMDTVIKRYDQVIEACNKKIHGIIWVLRESRSDYDPKNLRALMQEFAFAKCPIYLLYNNSEYLGRNREKTENIKTLLASVNKFMKDLNLLNIRGLFLSHEREDLSKRFLEILKDPVIPTKSEMTTYSQILKINKELLEKKYRTLIEQKAMKDRKKRLSAQICAAKISLKQCKAWENWAPTHMGHISAHTLTLESLDAGVLALFWAGSLVSEYFALIGILGYHSTMCISRYYRKKAATLKTKIEKLEHEIKQCSDKNPSAVLKACREWKERLEILRKVLLKRVDDGNGFGGSDNKGGGGPPKPEAAVKEQKARSKEHGYKSSSVEAENTKKSPTQESSLVVISDSGAERQASSSSSSLSSSSHPTNCTMKIVVESASRQLNAFVGLLRNL
mmetsp:Transcript_15157/g.24157  ORF Transcript_15157/g.24157 Transcript_15157/m.24157 type:complete len:548 (+) Transcript_15157:63-1706(+)